jgi:uncharacterized protein (TIGR02217 family)
MIYVDIEFPERIAFGAESDPMWMTELAVTRSGSESTNQAWSQSRHSYDVSFAVRNKTDYLLIRSHFHQVRGRAKSFPFKDYLDFEVSSSQGVLTSTGVADTYQMFKRYGSGDDLYDRKITRPDSGSVAIFRTRSGVTSNITGSSTVTYTTGVVVVTGHQSGDVYTWSGTFHVPCRYDTDRLPAVIVNKEPGAQGELLVQCQSIPLVEVRE